jgi:hypothetical protein
VLLYRHLDVGAETRGQGTDTHVYANRNAHNSAFRYGYPTDRSADRDVGADPHPMVPAYSHPHIYSGTHSNAVCHCDTHPLSHRDAYTHANSHPHGHPSTNGNTCANRGPDQHTDQHTYVDSDGDAYGHSHADTGAHLDRHAHPHRDSDTYIDADRHFDPVVVIGKHMQL